MMYYKALIFKDMETAKKILLEKDPKKQKALGRKVKNFNLIEWDEFKRPVVYGGNFLKFTQNESLKKALLDTTGTTLVEASPYDTIWGIGLLADDPRAMDRSQWLGQNLLGEILTTLRENLMEDDMK